MTSDQTEQRQRGWVARTRDGCGGALLFFAILLLPFVAGAFYLRYWWWPSTGWGDQSQRSPARVFQTVLDRPVPAGVSQILASGYASLGGCSIWLRFRATDAAVRSLTAGCVIVSDKEPYNSEKRKRQRIVDKDEIEDTMVSDQASGPSYARQVHWEGVFRSRHPECYSFDPDLRFHVNLFVDRHRHLAYAFASGW